MLNTKAKEDEGKLDDDHRSNDSDEGNMLNHLSQMDLDVGEAEDNKGEKDDEDPMFGLGNN